MNINIFTAAAEKAVLLHLKKEGESTYLVAVDNNGKVLPGGYLLGFNVDGSVFRPVGVSSEFGFKLDSAGRLDI